MTAVERTKARAMSIATVVAAIGFCPTARASSALEYPDNGTAQFSRGGAWLATATDPIAGHYNPAALAWQPTSFGIGMNLAFQTICYEREGPGGAEEGPSQSMTAQGLTYPETCNSNAGKPNVIPHVSFAWRISRKLGAALAVVPPSGYGLVEWPDLVTVQGRQIPAPQRYLSLYTKGTILFPTLSAGYAVTDDFAVGAGFIAGIAFLEFRSMSLSNVDETNAYDQFNQDNRSRIRAKDLFIPGFVASGLYRLTPNIDLAGWFRYIDKIRAKGDLEVIAQYYNQQAVRRKVCDYPGQTAAEPGSTCADITNSEDAKGKDAAKVTLAIPIEVRAGARWHVPRGPAAGLEAEQLRADGLPTRDPLRDDVYDVELNLTWAHNSAADKVKIRFPAGINVNGAPGTVPQNADRPTGWKDSYGARLGGQYNVMRDVFAVRAGTWVETSAIDEKYLSVTGVPALRGGVGGGLVFRIQRVDIETGYQHIWNAGLDNGGDGAQRAIAGTGTTPDFDNRSYHTINGGKVSQHANVFSLGAVARF